MSLTEGRNAKSKWLDYKSFCAVFHNQPTDLSVSQIKILFYCLLEGDDDMLNSGVFWDHILVPLTRQRKKIIQHLWDNLNVRNEDRVSLVRFKNRFFAKFHPKVISGEKTPAQIEGEFMQNIDFHGQIFGNIENYTIWEQFDQFMTWWSATEDNENRFLATIADCFRLSEFLGIYDDDIPETKPIELGQPKDAPQEEFGRNRRQREDSSQNRSQVQPRDSRRSEDTRDQWGGRSRWNQARGRGVENNIYGARERQSDSHVRPRTNFYDQHEEQVNLYQSNQKRMKSNRNYNIISGHDQESSRRNVDRKSRNDIRTNFYDQLQGKPDPKRDLSQKRIATNDRRSQMSRSRRRIDKSPARSRISER